MMIYEQIEVTIINIKAIELMMSKSNNPEKILKLTEELNKLKDQLKYLEAASHAI